MKRLFAVMVLTLLVALSAQAQCGSNVSTSGCVGACGTSYAISYTVTSADLPSGGVGIFCLLATSNSLCASHNAYATMDRNGGTPQTGNLDQGAILSFKGRIGDVFNITVNTVLVNPNIDCFWFGETQFALVH